MIPFVVPIYITCILAALLAVVPAALLPDGARAQPRPKSEFRVLVFSKTEGYRHDSIETGAAAIRNLGLTYGFTVHRSEDATIFNDHGLSPYRVIVFLNTSGTIFNDDQRDAFKRFIKNGGGFVGIHAAADTEHDWAWYGGLVGAHFASHPEVQQATIRVTQRDHRSTRHLPAQWVREDEWYDFQSPPEGVMVLAELDESSYSGGAMGPFHPIAWYHRYDGGRSWYTGGGHTEESFRDPHFLDHILGGILWAAGE